MKIGILTHHFIANFGAFLQAYALQETIKHEYPDAEVKIVNYIHLKHCIVNNGGWFRFYLSRETPRAWFHKIHLPYRFWKARQEHMNLTPLYFNAAEVNRENFDVIVVGSDEVWNFSDPKGDAEIKFGIGLNCPRLVSYAPSVGNSTADNVPQYVKKGLAKFKSISVRDTLGQDLVEHITGNRPQKVLDPTFLLDFPKEEVELPNKDYILFYYAEHLPRKIKKQIFEYANEHGLAVYGAGECDKAYTDITVNLTPFQWVHMFRNAKFVITGTFHGVAFSIENQRQFKVFLTQKNRIKKVEDLLSSLNITNRNIDDNYIFDLDNPTDEIDYKAVNEMIKVHRTSSLQYLRNAING